MSNAETPIEWEGTSYNNLMTFPAEARHRFGFQLGRLQIGLDPMDGKSFTGLGKAIKGVREIRIWAEDVSYRVVYVRKFRNTITVLHCFKKKTQQTDKQDINLIVKRYKAASKRHLLGK